VYCPGGEAKFNTCRVPFTKMRGCSCTWPICHHLKSRVGWETCIYRACTQYLVCIIKISSWGPAWLLNSCIYALLHVWNKGDFFGENIRKLFFYGKVTLTLPPTLIFPLIKKLRNLMFLKTFFDPYWLVLTWFLRLRGNFQYIYSIAPPQFGILLNYSRRTCKGQLYYSQTYAASILL